MPPPTRPTARRRLYSQDNVERALNAIKYEGMGIGTAAKAFNVPKSTLHDKLRGKYKQESAIGRPSVLTAEEEAILTQWVIDIGKAGFSVSKSQLIESVAHLIKELKRDNPFRNGVPGEKWFSLFLKRNPIIAQKVAQGLTTLRANVTEEKIKTWFTEVKRYVEEKSLLQIFQDPRRVFNADDTAFLLCPKGKKVLAKKGEAVYAASGNDKDRCVTVLVNGNAAGQLAPTMVVYQYEQVPAAIAQSFPDDWAISKSENGWMTSATFYEYVTNVFHPWLLRSGIELPIVLFLDGHSSHLNKHLSDFCSNNQIEVVALYPNSTHLLQPMDVSVFKPLEAGWRKGVDRFIFESGGRSIRKDEFAPLLQKVMKESVKPETIANSFVATGLIDLNLERVRFANVIGRSGESQTSLQFLQLKLKDTKNCLSYIESKIGVEKLQRFCAGDILLCDESLHELWTLVRLDISNLEEQIARRGDTATPQQRPEGAEELQGDGVEAEELI